MIYGLTALLILCVIMGFVQVWVWLRILAAKANRDEIEIKEIKERLLLFDRKCKFCKMPFQS